MQTEQNQDMQQWKKKAKAMVSDQLVSRGISDFKVLRAMENTPRHLFVPEAQQSEAYTDKPLPIGEGQTISQPYIVALMTELLKLKGDEKVLEIGTGSGYQAAILAQLADSVCSVELIPELAEKASLLLNQLGYSNVKTKCGDGYEGWAEHASFDCIIVTAAPPEIPQKLIEQLKSGGKIVLPVGKLYQELIVVSKSGKGIMKERIIPVRFVPMVKPE